MKSPLSTLVFIMIATCTVAQHSSTDCLGAIPVCEDIIVQQVGGIGTDDFAAPDNDPGCLLIGENPSTWFRLDFHPDAPDTTRLAFVLSSPNGYDLDFALFAATESGCDSLGEPIRCSFSALSDTGLALNATDFSESAGGDGFTAPVTPQDGNSFFLLVNNYSFPPGEVQLDFTSGADALNCNPGLTCELIQVPDSLCPGESFDLIGDTSFSGSWTSEPDLGLQLLSDSTDVSTTLNVPMSFPSGSYTFSFIPDAPENAAGCPELSFEVVISQPLTDLIPLEAVCPNGDGTVMVDLPSYAAQYADSVELQFFTINGPAIPTGVVDLPVGTVLAVVATTNGCPTDLFLPIPQLEVPAPPDFAYQVCADSTKMAVFDLDSLAILLDTGADAVIFKTTTNEELEGMLTSAGDTILAYGVTDGCESAPAEIVLTTLPAPPPPQLMCVDATETSLTVSFGSGGPFDYFISFNGQSEELAQTTDTLLTFTDLVPNTEIGIIAWQLPNVGSVCSFVSSAARLSCSTEMSSATTRFFDDQLLKISPNPTAGVVQVNFPEGRLIRYRLLDAGGRIIRERDFSGSEIDLSALPNGVYTIIATDSRGEKCWSRIVRVSQ